MLFSGTHTQRKNSQTFSLYRLAIAYCHTLFVSNICLVFGWHLLHTVTSVVAHLELVVARGLLVRAQAAAGIVREPLELVVTFWAEASFTLLWARLQVSKLRQEVLRVVGLV